MIGAPQRRVIERTSAHLPMLAVLLVVPLAAFVGWRPASLLAQLLPVAAVAAPLLVALMRRPAWGIIALIAVSFLVPWEIGTGTKVALNATVVLVPLLAGVWILRMVATAKQVRLSPSRVNAPALMFAAAATLSLIAGRLRWIPFSEPASLPSQIGGWALYVFPMALLLLTANQITDLRWLRLLAWVFIGLGGAYIVLRLVPGSSGIALALFVPASVGSMFWTWLAAMSYAQALLNHDLRLSRRLVLAVITLLALYIGWTQSKEWISGWLPPLVAVWVITWLRSWRWGVALGLAGGLVTIAAWSALYPQVYTATQEYSTTSRVATWPIMWELIKASPLIGLGPSNYYRYTALYPILGYHVVFNSHNNYVDIVAQTGLVGLGAFGWLVLEFGRLGWRLRMRAQNGFGRAYACGALGGLVGMLTAGVMGDWFLPFTYNIGLPGFRAAIFAWLFLGGLVALEQITRRQRQLAGEL